MAKQRPSSQKRDREFRKRERDRKKREKAALKRAKREGRLSSDDTPELGDKLDHDPADSPTDLPPD